MGVSYGLLVAAVLAGLGLFEQIREARGSREASLRPVLVVTGTVSDPISKLRIANMGTGPALNIEVRAWIRGTNSEFPWDIDERARFIAEESRAIDMTTDPGLQEEHIALRAGGAVLVPVFRSTGDAGAHEGDRVHFRISYEDVFGNPFIEPSTGFGHKWFSDSETALFESTFD